MPSITVQCPLCDKKLSEPGLAIHLFSHSHSSAVQELFLKTYAPESEEATFILKGDNLVSLLFNKTRLHCCFGCKHIWKNPPKNHLESCQGKEKHLNHIKRFYSIPVEETSAASKAEIEDLKKQLEEMKKELKKAKEDAEYYKEQCNEKDDEILELSNGSETEKLGREVAAYQMFVEQTFGFGYSVDELRGYSKQIKEMNRGPLFDIQASLAASATPAAPVAPAAPKRPVTVIPVVTEKPHTVPAQPETIQRPPSDLAPPKSLGIHKEDAVEFDEEEIEREMARQRLEWQRKNGIVPSVPKIEVAPNTYPGAKLLTNTKLMKGKRAAIGG